MHAYEHGYSYFSDKITHLRFKIFRYLRTFLDLEKGKNSKARMKPRMKRGLAVLNVFPTQSCILFKLKHSWNIHQTFILLI